MLKALRYVFYAECLVRLRRSQEWLYPACFFLIIILLFPLAITAHLDLMQKLLPGYLWIAALFSSFLALENLFAIDHQEGFTAHLLHAKMPLSVLITCKLLAHWLVTELPLVVLTPLIGWLCQLPTETVWMLTFSLVLGTPMLTFVGALGAALTIGLRQQSTLLGFIILPLVIPILVFGVSIPMQTAAHLSVKAPIAFLTGLLVLSVLFLPLAIAGALRMGLND